MVYVHDSLRDMNWMMELMDEVKNNCNQLLEEKFEELFDDMFVDLKNSVSFLIFFVKVCSKMSMRILEELFKIYLMS